jgi:nitroreductase
MEQAAPSRSHGLDLRALELQRLITTRRTVHAYAARPLPPGALERGLEAAISAPNHRLTEPWRFIRTGPKTRQALLEIGVDRLTQGGKVPLGSNAEQVIERTVINPAELLIVSQVLDPRPDVQHEDYAAIACAIQNLSLALWAEGVGSKWSTTAVMHDPRSYPLLGIDHERERIVGFVWLGYPARSEPAKARRKKSWGEVVRALP